MLIVCVRDIVIRNDILSFDLYTFVIVRTTGSTLALDEETVQGVLAACRQEIG